MWSNRGNQWGRMRNPSKYKTVGLFLLLIAVLLLGTLLSYRATIRIAESERWVSHTYEVMGAVDSVIVTLQRTQSAANDFIATGNDKYLTAYRTASALIASRIDDIRIETKDNAWQQQATANVATKVLPYQAALDEAVKARMEGRVSQLTGDQLRAITQYLRVMKSHESELLTQRSQEAAVSLTTTRLGLLLGGLVNCILLVLGGYLVMHDQEQRSQIKESRMHLAAIVDSSDDAIIGKKLDGTISSWNKGAERLYEYTAEQMIGRSIYEIVPPEREAELRTIMKKLSRAERIDHLETYRLRRDGTKIEVELTVSPVIDDHGRVIGASAIGRNITERKLLERSLHQLSIRILRAQDEERRRIAREIHDTTVQKLALLSMNLAQMRTPLNLAKSLTTLDSSQELTSECVQELRTLSYVLHPPMLDELGLASALKIYVEGISQRSGITVTTEIDPNVPRLDPEVEMALFRVAQESLSNVLRHSGSKTAKIRLSNHSGVELTIADEGTGFSTKQQVTELPVAVGVGIPGMNERISQLGGVLTIDSGPGGTTVRARVPGERAACA